MAVNRVPVLKRCRSLGMDPIYLGISKKSNRQLKRANRKMSEYGLQLREKQKAKRYYGLLEGQFHKYFEMASKMKGVTGEELLNLLERRLDNVVYRMGLGSSRAEARQLVTHGHFTINGKRVDIPSYLVTANDVVALCEKTKSASSTKIDAILSSTNGRTVPEWIDFDADKLSANIVRLPNRADIDFPIEEHLIVELYSK